MLFKFRLRRPERETRAKPMCGASGRDSKHCVLPQGITSISCSTLLDDSLQETRRVWLLLWRNFTYFGLMSLAL